MGRASRRRADQRSVRERTTHDLEKVFPLCAPTLPMRKRLLPYPARLGLDRLAELVEQRTVIERSIDEGVALLVELGAGWGDIGRALGISRQGARQRYGSRSTP